MTEGKTKTRMTILAALVAFMFAVLSTRLWFLQVLATEEFSKLATTNRVRIVPEPPPRGRILDREGRVIVGNRPSRVILIDRTNLKDRDREEVLFRLSQLLDISPEEIATRMEDVHYFPFEPVPVAFDVSKDDAFYIGEHRDLFPGVSLRVAPVRDYPNGDLAVHALGSTGEISEEELKEPAFESYRQGTEIGKTGVERVYERYLQGEEGLVKYEVNSKGDVLQDLGGRKPRPGDDLVLSIDRKIQAFTEESLQLGIDLAHGIYDKESGRYLQAGAGAAIVMDPDNGRILASVSLPEYDPRMFLGGLSEKEFRRLRDPDANFPLLNRTVQSAYPPGSTFKPFVAAAAIREGFASQGGSYPCPSEYALENDPSGTVFNNWKSSSGYLSLAGSLVDSCDTVYYRFGHQFYQQRSVQGEIFQQYLRGFGFSRATGIDLPAEEDGLIPTARWKERAAKQNPFISPGAWVPGDDIVMAIGQGSVETSPMQLAVAYSAIANGGTLWEPRLGLALRRPDGRVVRKIEPEAAGKVPYSAETLAFLRGALVGVTTPGGTAASAFAGFPLSSIPVAGKTGTAEIKPKQPFSWFAAMAPAYDPQYVVVAVVEEGGHGSETAAPVVRRILEGLFGLQPQSQLQSGVRVD
jgi:penicillin-binding protein 2